MWQVVDGPGPPSLGDADVVDADGALDLREARRRIRSAFPLVHGHPDVAGVLRQPDLLRLLGPAMAAPFVAAGVTVVCAPEARGPILGALVAAELGAGLMLVRKVDRNHPGADRRVESGVTWRGSTEAFQARSWDLSPGDLVLVVDDWITTGSSIRAVRTLVEGAGGLYVGASVLVDKTDGDTRRDLQVHALVGYDEIIGPA